MFGDMGLCGVDMVEKTGQKLTGIMFPYQRICRMSRIKDCYQMGMGKLLMSQLSSDISAGKKHDTPSTYYESSNAKTIRLIFLGTSINTMYWGTKTVLTAYSNIMDGVATGFGAIDGAEVDFFLFVVSTASLYLTSSYGKHSVYKCFETPDRKRLALQVHTLFGNPGHIYEFPIGNATIVPSSKKGTVNLRIEGISKNFVFANEEEFNKNSELRELLSRQRVDVLKQERIAWRGKGLGKGIGNRRSQSRKN